MPTEKNPFYIMAVDAGTESVRVGVFNQFGSLLSSAAEAYETVYPQSGWAEQDPDAWWTALTRATRRCLENEPVKGKPIAGISVDATTCTLVPLGSEGKHLSPALLWMDVRAADQAQRIFQTGHRALQYSPAGCNAEWMLCKALWLRENKFDVYQDTTHFIEYLDWLVYRLTGRLVLNLNTTTQRWYYNQREWGFPVDLFEEIGLPELISKIPQQILPAGEKVGGLTSEAAAALGLPESTPVIQGGGDAFVALLGMGVTQLGEIGLIAGSSNVIAGFIEREVHGPGVFGAFPDALIPGLWLIEGGQVSTGSILAWFKRCFALDIQPDMVYATLDNEAAKIAPGSDGLMVLDYFQGNRTPYTDSLARGAVWGLSLHTTRAHLFRGLMEGIAYGTGHVLEALADLGCYPHRMVACGGATQSDVFMQIIADVCGIPISLTEVAEASLLGGAVLAAVGSGLYPDIPSASKEMVRMTKTFEPNQVHHDAYQFYFNLYKETYPRLKDLMHQMGMHQHRKE